MNSNRPDLVDAPALERLDRARKQLSLILDFFPRVETKLSVVLGVNLGMLGLLASKAPPMARIDFDIWCILGAFLVCAGLSLYHLYKGSFPDLDGGQKSIVYFREIATMREADFVDTHTAKSTDDLAKDYLCQAWANARILARKFNSLRWGYIFMAFSIPFWVAALIFFARLQLDFKPA